MLSCTKNENASKVRKQTLVFRTFASDSPFVKFRFFAT